MNGATWVLQSWQANPRQDMIDALDKNRLLVLDLWCEAQENWRKRISFDGTPWLWCTIENNLDSIPDYANRQWNGLLGGFYYHRWSMWLAALQDSLAAGEPVDEAAVRGRIRDWELSWTRRHDRFPTEPHGDVVTFSAELLARYSPDALRPEPDVPRK